ncbi:hypothetical protein BpHYR1_010055 [Brachionus plicatilis]|uniref:Uncharacterized protein n=1 Tax=Brachionus plicatilis TaxID=10195 RepID=A0A3M7QS81_BRAPC|nr:hypothetical protein BpHYR1_010055 [Brachionus plicatilis]
MKQFVWVELNDSVYENKSMVEFIDQMEHDDNTNVTLFKLLSNEVYCVPLYVVYNCKIYVSPDTKTFLPSQIFDLRGSNLRLEHRKIFAFSLNIDIIENKGPAKFNGIGCYSSTRPVMGSDNLHVMCRSKNYYYYEFQDETNDETQNVSQDETDVLVYFTKQKCF